MKKKPQPFTSNNEYGYKFLFWSLVAFKPTGIITQSMYCYVALSFIAGETNSHVLKFLLKLFTLPRMLNKNITFQIIFYFQVSATALNKTLFFTLGGLSRFYGSDMNFLILGFFSFLLHMCMCICHFFRHFLVTQVRKKLVKLVLLVIFLSVLVSLSSLFVVAYGGSLWLLQPLVKLQLPALLLELSFCLLFATTRKPAAFSWDYFTNPRKSTLILSKVINASPSASMLLSRTTVPGHSYKPGGLVLTFCQQGWI